MMYRKKLRCFIILVILSLIPIALSAVTKSMKRVRRELSDFRVTELTFRAVGFEVDTEANKEISYEGEITDAEVVERLWKMITEQQKQPEIKGGNHLSGTPYLVLHAPNGADYTLSYTWDREEWVYDAYGEPGISLVGRAFVISGTRSEKYQAISQETEKEFAEIIMDYLRSNATAGEEAGKSTVISKEKVWQKSNGTF